MISTAPLAAARDALGDLVLASRCWGCGEVAWLICPACREAIRPAPRIGTVEGVPCAAAAVYQEPLRGLLVAHKDRGAWGLVRPLGVLLAAALGVLSASADAPVVLVPVPSNPRAVRDRGYDHSAALAKAAARASPDCAVVRHWLKRVSGSSDQAGLGLDERLGNQTATMRFDPGHRPIEAATTVIIVDDIITTGATITEAVRACRAGGHEPAGVAAVAATLRRH